MGSTSQHQAEDVPNSTQLLTGKVLGNLSSSANLLAESAPPLPAAPPLPPDGPAPPRGLALAGPPRPHLPPPVLSKMEGALSAPLPVRLLLFVALPAAGWLITSVPMPPSTAPKVGQGGRSGPLLCGPPGGRSRRRRCPLRQADGLEPGRTGSGRPERRGGSPGCRAGWAARRRARGRRAGVLESVVSPPATELSPVLPGFAVKSARSPVTSGVWVMAASWVRAQPLGLARLALPT